MLELELSARERVAFLVVVLVVVGVVLLLASLNSVPEIVPTEIPIPEPPW